MNVHTTHSLTVLSALCCLSLLATSCTSGRDADAVTQAQRAKSYYDQGREYQKQQLWDSAVVRFEQSIDVQKTLNAAGGSPVDARFLSGTYASLSDCYNALVFDGYAKDHAVNAYETAKATGDSLYILNRHYRMALSYEYYDKAEAASYLRQCLSEAGRLGDSIKVRQCLDELFSLSMDGGFLHEAAFYLILSGSAGFGDRYYEFMRGQYFEAICQWDSAIHNYRYFVDRPMNSSQPNVIKAYTALEHCYRQKHRYESALEMADMALYYQQKVIADNVRRSVSRQDYARMTQFLALNREKDLQDRSDRDTTMIRRLLHGIFMLCVVAVAVMVFFKRRHKKRIKEMQLRLAAIDRALAERKEGGDDKPAATGSLEDERLNLSMALFREHPVCARLDRLKRTKNFDYLPADEREAIHGVLYAMFGDYLKSLQTELPRLNADDCFYCLLSLLGYTNNEILPIMCSSLSALRSRKTHIKSKIPDEWFGYFFNKGK